MENLINSIVITEKTQAYIVSRFSKEDGADETNSESQIMNGAVATLQFVLSSSLPNLTVYEWQCVLNTFNGTMSDHEHIESFQSIDSRMMEDMGAADVDELEEKYAQVVLKMRKLNVIEQYSVADMCRKYWNNSHSEQNLLATIEKLRGV